jgi:hypothetical protein
MPDRLFLFLQLEFPWDLGPADGRYVVRREAGAEPEHVVVLGTLGARQRTSMRIQRFPIPGRPRPDRARDPATPEPAPVATARATIIDPVSVSAERQAQAWLKELDAVRETRAALAVLNRLLHYHRIAAADPFIREVTPAQALVVRAGWGEGDQVADGRWLHAMELPVTESTRGPAGARRRVLGDRSAALRPQERLAELLGARGAVLLCEELVLRARLDLDHGRLHHAAIELQAAYVTALAELRAEHREDLAVRIAELDKLGAGVAAQARAAMPGPTGETTEEADTTGGQDQPDGASGTPEGGLDEEVIRHALERLEAALRARTAPGFGR